MAGSVEKIYSSALFELFEENNNTEKAFKAALSELSAVNDALTAAPELAKFTLIPTVSRGDKLDLLKKVFDGKLSKDVFNFICVLCEKGRLSNFGGIFRSFRKSYYEKFGITPVTATSAFALTKEQREKITAKMAGITGNKVELSEKIDKELLGGVVLDYGGARIDASVKTRLDSLKREIAETVL